MDTVKTAVKPKAKNKVVKVTFTAEEKSNEKLREGRVTEYEVKPENMDKFIIETEKVNFKSTPSGGLKKTSRPVVAIYEPREYMRIRSSFKRLGFTHFRLLHAPDGTKPELLKLPE